MLFVQTFEKQEVERISSLRNVVWTHLNQLSQQCVTSDEVTIHKPILSKTPLLGSKTAQIIYLSLHVASLFSAPD